MSDHAERHRSVDPRSLAGALAELEAMVDPMIRRYVDLRIEELAARLETEVRTERLVIENPDGVERLVTEHQATEWSTSFELRMPTKSGDAYVRLSTVDDPDGDRSSVGAGAVRSGDVAMHAGRDGDPCAYLSIEEIEPRGMLTVDAAGIEVCDDGFKPSWHLATLPKRVPPA